MQLCGVCFVFFPAVPVLISGDRSMADIICYILYGNLMKKWNGVAAVILCILIAHRHLPLDNLSCRTSLRNRKCDANKTTTTFPYLHQNIRFEHSYLKYSVGLSLYIVHTNQHGREEEKKGESINWIEFKLCKNIILGCSLFDSTDKCSKKSR